MRIASANSIHEVRLYNVDRTGATTDGMIGWMALDGWLDGGRSSGGPGSGIVWRIMDICEADQGQH